jgi:serine/threonine-protein kinase
MKQVILAFLWILLSSLIPAATLASVQESTTAQQPVPAPVAPAEKKTDIPIVGGDPVEAARTFSITGLMPPQVQQSVEKYKKRVEQGIQSRPQTSPAEPSAGQPQPGASARVQQPQPDPALEAARDGGEVADLLTRPDLMEQVKPEDRNGAANQFATLMNQAGNNKAAIKLADDVIGRDPENRDALNNRAMGNYGLGQYQRSVEDASRVLGADKDNGRAYTTRALANYQMANYVQAFEDAQRALSLDANNQTAHEIAKLSGPRMTTPEQLGIDKQAAEQLHQEYAAMVQQANQIAAAPAAAPVHPALPALDSLNQQARQQIADGDYRRAILLTSQVLERSPENISALQLRAGAMNMAGEYRKAVEDATAALDRDPDNVLALDTRASALLQLGKPQQALLDAERSVTLDRKNGYAYKNRAAAKQALGDLAGMIADYRLAAKHSPQFDAELKRVARQYSLPLEAEAAKGQLERQTPPVAEPEPAPWPRQRARVLIILTSSIIGGLLIALGLLRVSGGPPLKRAKIKAPLPGAGTETVQALSSGPGLHAGFNVLRTLGNGGMGVVYEAEDKALGRKVAIKQMRQEIRDNPKERERFLQEARIVAALHHPNIVDIHTIVEDEGDLYMVFEFIEGQTVEQILGKKTRLALREAQYVVRGVCAALHYAHQKGVIHRDLKPSNIMITRDGMIKVMDFGIARQAKDALANTMSTQTVAGTPLYMAPEQEQGIVRKESDVYALGACLYEMITGLRPFAGASTTARKLAKHYEKPSRVRSGLPPELDALIDWALEPDPDKRLRTAADFSARLDAIKAPQVSPA